MNEIPSALYEVYDDTMCPRCGNTENNHDHGPYDESPLDAELGGTPDPCVHLMTCGRCGKCFDVAPEEHVAAVLAERFPELAAVPDDLRGLT